MLRVEFPVNDSVGSCRRMLRCHSDLLNQKDNETDCVVRKLQGCTHFAEIVQTCVAKPGFWENVLDIFSCFYIEIICSNFTFCGAYTLSFLACHTISAKKSTLPKKILLGILMCLVSDMVLINRNISLKFG